MLKDKNQKTIQNIETSFGCKMLDRTKQLYALALFSATENTTVQENVTGQCIIINNCFL